MTETDLSRAIREAVNLQPDAYVIRVQSGMLQALYRGRARWIHLAPKGTSDYLGIGPGGQFLALEVKAKRGKLTTDQRLFLRRIRDLGGVAAEVRSAAEAVAVVRGMR